MPGNNIRSFIAVEVNNPEVIQKIELVQKHLKSIQTVVIKEVEPYNLHITLKFLGEIDRSKLGQVVENIRQIRFEPFEIGLRGIGYFPGGGRVNVVWVGVEDPTGLLQAIGDEVQERMRRIGFPSEKFTPHLTIARVKSVRDRQPLLQLLSEYSEEEFGRQRIEYICVKKSTLTPKGPIYEDILRHGGNVK